jgi:hypothetical protein
MAIFVRRLSDLKVWKDTSKRQESGVTDRRDNEE